MGNWLFAFTSAGGLMSITSDREIIRRALFGVRSICSECGRSVEKWRADDAQLLTGIDVSRQKPLWSAEWGRVEAYRGFSEYLRGRLEDWKPGLLVGQVGLSLSRAFTTIVYASMMEWIEKNGGGVVGEDNDSASNFLDISISFREWIGMDHVTWLTRAQYSLYLPITHFVEPIIGTYLNMEGWRERDEYAGMGLDRLGDLLAAALISDWWVRTRALAGEAAEWEYYQCIRRELPQYDRLVWSGMIDMYVPYAWCIDLAANNVLEEVELASGVKAWRITISNESLADHARRMKDELETISAHEEFFRRYYDFVSKVLSGDRRGFTPLMSIKGLWEGWARALYPDLARTFMEGSDTLYLLVLRPEAYPPFGRLNVLLLVGSLAANHQLAHIYSHVGRLFAEKARKEGFGSVAKRLKPLYMKGGWAKYYKELSSAPERPMPSIYEQILHTPTVLVGMLYGVLSSASTVLGLEPKIPSNPLDLLKKRRPDLTGPDFSQSLDLLIGSASLPVGILEKCYLDIEDALEKASPRS